ncbi:hypothetical protein [Akkermansia sp.]|uniref:hypothetical protein n=1 Tax=Akkermansia sp. TaxID=1872421 RepID=UPI0025C3B425|nr:hypothetical protein [Akkermansia sp.]MCC8149182.1 hypothetical protein [Akkermansia sp.]
MDKQSTEHNEETLVAMLASFRKEACYHDNFEEDFLRNFHLRKETDPATHSAWKLLLERLDNYLQNFRGWQWVYASMSIVTLAAVGVIIASGNMDEPSDSYVSSNKEENILKGTVPVSKETIEQPSTEVATSEKPEFTTGASSHETSVNDNQLKTDSNTDKKPVSRVLIEM